MEENGEEDGRWGDGYRFEKVVDAGWRAKRGIESFFNRMAGGGEGVSNVSFRNGETLLHFLSRQRVEIAWFLPQYIPFPVASIHFDYRHFLQLFYFRSLLIRRCEKKKKKRDVEGFARIHGSLYILSIDIAVQIVKEYRERGGRLKV